MNILFDIGGTNMRIAVSRDGATFGEPRIVPTPRDFNEGVEILGEISEELSEGGKIEKAVGGIAGIIDKGILVYSPNNEGWKGKPIQEASEKALGVPVRITNDAALAGLGEAVYGAGKGFPIVAYFTVSTGIGGVRIVDGKIDKGTYGFEPGAQIIDINDEKTGYLEGRVSGSALRKKFGKSAEDITDDAVWKEFEKILAVGIHNSILHWSPDVVVIGGAIALAEDFFSIKRVEQQVHELLQVFPTVPVFKKAELGDESGLRGAMAL